MAEHRGKQSIDTFWFGEYVQELLDQRTGKSEGSSVILDNKQKARKKLNSSIKDNGFNEFEKRHPVFFEKRIPLAFTDPTSNQIQFDGSHYGKEEDGLAGLIRITPEGFSTWLSPRSTEKGVLLGNLTTLNQVSFDFVEDCLFEGMFAGDSEISSLMQSLSTNAMIISVPDHVEVEGIIKIEIACESDNTISPIHLIARAGQFAKVNLIINVRPSTIIEEKAIVVLQNNFMVEDHGALSVFIEQVASKNTLILEDQKLSQARNSYGEIFLFDRGSFGSSSKFSVDLHGEGAESVITGIYRPGKKSRYYYDTEQIHSASHTQSDLLYKGVLGNQTFTSWKGNIVVEKDTKGTNGYQANNNLIIDESAKVESIPGLEIITNDVKCSHGVTIGNIDKNQMFYLQSRGINKEDAQGLIIDGFLESSLKRVKSGILLNQVSQKFKN